MTLERTTPLGLDFAWPTSVWVVKGVASVESYAVDPYVLPGHFYLLCWTTEETALKHTRLPNMTREVTFEEAHRIAREFVAHKPCKGIVLHDENDVEIDRVDVR